MLIQSMYEQFNLSKALINIYIRDLYLYRVHILFFMRSKYQQHLSNTYHDYNIDLCSCYNRSNTTKYKIKTLLFSLKNKINGTILHYYTLYCIAIFYFLEYHYNFTAPLNGPEKKKKITINEEHSLF